MRKINIYDVDDALIYYYYYYYINTTTWLGGCVFVGKKIWGRYFSIIIFTQNCINFVVVVWFNN